MAYIFERMQLFEGFEDRNETNSSKILWIWQETAASIIFQIIAWK